jgi:hypothetical protein
MTNLGRNSYSYFTMVTVKNAVFWDMEPCGLIINRFGGTCRLHLQGRRNNAREESVGRLITCCLTLFLSRVISSTLKMEATRSSETSVYNKPTRCHISEDGILVCTGSVHTQSCESDFNILKLHVTQTWQLATCWTYEGWEIESRWGKKCLLLIIQTGSGTHAVSFTMSTEG